MADNNDIPEFEGVPGADSGQEVQSVDLSAMDEDLSQVDINDSASEVASAPAKNILIIVVMAVVAAIFLYMVIFQSDEADEQVKKETGGLDSPIESATVVDSVVDQPRVDIGVVDSPVIPEIEDLIDTVTDEIEDQLPVAIVTPPPIIIPEQPKLILEKDLIEDPVVEEQIIEEDMEVVDSPEVEEEEEELAGVEIKDVWPGFEDDISAEELAAIDAKRKSRRSSSMLVVNGGGEEESIEEVAESGSTERTSSATSVEATLVGDTDYIVGQGKMMSAVLETAINTSLKGALRAIISRDVYAESGRTVLIPRGSRLIGSYDDDVSKGQTRIAISWERLIRPDGIDIEIGSEGTDQLGRAGVTGLIDNRFFDIISNSVLLSTLSIVGALGLEEVSDSTGGSGTSSSTTTNTDGSSTTNESGTPSDIAILNAVNDLSDVTSSTLEGLTNLDPLITVDQGTVIKVFVNKDLIFPPSIISSGGIKTPSSVVMIK